MRAEPESDQAGNRYPLSRVRGSGPGSGPIARAAGRSLWLALLLLPTLTLSAPERASALTTPDDLCTGNPCIISSDKDIESGSIIDFGTRNVILERTLDVGSGSMTLRAGSFTMRDRGKLDAKGGASGPGGAVVIETVNDIVIDTAPLGGAVNLNGADAGALLLQTTAGSVTITHRVVINMSSSISDASGGDLTIISAGAVSLAGKIEAGGGGLGGGGSVNIVASGGISLTGPVDVAGGEFGGGFVSLGAGGSVTLGPVAADGGGDAGDGGALDVIAEGSITLVGAFDARGSFGIDGCGDGGDIDLLATGDITVQAEIDIDGPGTCCGGFLMMDGADVRLESAISARGPGAEGCGGDLEIAAGGLLSLTGSIQADGGDLGGDIALFAAGDLELQGPIDARGRGTFASGSLFLELEAGARLTISSSIDARGGPDGFGGDVVLAACELTVNPGVSIQADGNVGTISMFANDVLTLRGAFSAGPSEAFIDLFFGPQADPPDIAGASFNIPPNLVLDPLLVPCRLCLNDAECADDNLCTDDVCIPATGCTNPPNSDPCDDGNACTEDDTCSGGVCLGGPPPDCDDANLCTDDSCNVSTGCVNAPNSDPCDDGAVCTDGDFCGGGACVGGPPLDCSDGNLCTDDLCDPIDGCSNPLNSDPCEDGNPCTEGDTCSGGACVSGGPRDCDDANTCTDDSCNVSTGCVNAPNSDPCNDGTVCTNGDVCSGGTCVGGPPLDCSDGNLCTDDICDPITGCSNPPNSEPCDDGDACTDGDVCNAGACVSGPALDCDDNYVCTLDTCDTIDGCEYETLPGCSDADRDQKLDEEDECTTLDWTPSPKTPSNQHPLAFGLALKNLTSPGGHQMKAKGFFNPAPSDPQMDPATNGVHVRIADEGGLLYDVSIPGGAVGTLPCGARDGWKADLRPGKLKWKYKNKSGALPPGCEPGSAKGIASAQIKDRRSSSKRAFHFKVAAKGTTLLGTPSLPVRRVQFDLVLAAQPSEGQASAEAIAGLCAEALIVGDPVPEARTKPRCKVETKGAAPEKIDCKGL
jgi:hypothetical protein